MTQFNLMESWKIVSKHTMSKEKGYGTKAIASVPYPSILLFWVFAEMGGFLFEKGWSENIHCAKKGGFLLKATFFCVILVS